VIHALSVCLPCVVEGLMAMTDCAGGEGVGFADPSIPPAAAPNLTFITRFRTATCLNTLYRPKAVCATCLCRLQVTEAPRDTAHPLRLMEADPVPLVEIVPTGPFARRRRGRFRNLLGTTWCRWAGQIVESFCR